jgi:hypothetical protein
MEEKRGESVSDQDFRYLDGIFRALDSEHRTITVEIRDGEGKPITKVYRCTSDTPIGPETSATVKRKGAMQRRLQTRFPNGRLSTCTSRVADLDR